MNKISEETIGKIKELHDQGLSNLKIAKELGIGNQTVSRYLKERFGIEKEKRVKHIDQDIFEKLWEEGRSDKEIAEFFGVKETTIRTFRTKGENSGKFNVIRNFSQTEQRLSEIQDQFIRGSLLGDLNLSNPTSNRHINSRLALVHSNKQEELFFKKVEILGEFMGSYKLYEAKPDPRTGNIYKTWRGNSKSHKVFTNIYNELYPNNKKVLTQEYLDTVHHPIALAYWFMDDGTYNGVFATHCFSLPENELLCTWLAEKWGINCTIQHNLNQFQIYIKSESRLKFEKLIFPYMLPSMYYKLKYLDVLKAESVG